MKKSIGELIDQLAIVNNKIFYLVDKAQKNKQTKKDAKKLQDLKRFRPKLVKAINEHFDEKNPPAGGKKGIKKSIAELIDKLGIINIKVFYLIEKVYQDKHTRKDAKKIQSLNKSRSKLVNSINKYLGDEKKDIKDIKV